VWSGDKRSQSTTGSAILALFELILAVVELLPFVQSLGNFFNSEAFILSI
jgi:hypothetical protein